MSEDKPAHVRRQMFIKPTPVPKLSPERLKRQSMITQLTFSLFHDRTQAISFLNSVNPSLGGRPLAIATDSIEGYSAVEQAVRLLVRPHLGSQQ